MNHFEFVCLILATELMFRPPRRGSVSYVQSVVVAEQKDVGFFARPLIK